MTTPTQAQVEALAVTISKEKLWPWDLCLDAARLRLTAAAEVGAVPSGMISILAATEEMALVRAATIERCAQVADDLANNDLPEWCSIAKQIAAAIRALKDKP